MTTKNTAVQTGGGIAPRGITLSGQHLVDVLVLMNQLKRIANDSEVIHCGALSDINDDDTIRDMINAAHFAVNHPASHAVVDKPINYNIAGVHTPKPDERFRFLFYVETPIVSEGVEYPVSQWFDSKKDRYVFRITSPKTGKVVRTFTSQTELDEYRQATRPLRWYRVECNHRQYSRQFVSDGLAFEWAMSFTDGPDILSISRFINDAWCAWVEPKSNDIDGAWVNRACNIRQVAD